MSKRYSIFLTALFCAFLGGMALLSLLLPKESFSELENRYLQKAPTLSFSSVVVNGKFMEEAEDYVSDHIAGRDFWVALKAWSERLSGKRENEGVYFGREDTLLNQVADPDEKQLSQRIVRPAELEAALDENTCMVTIMAANNEIGTLQPVAEIGKICRAHGVLFHTDAVQAVGHTRLHITQSDIDLLSLSAHKFHGPKGAGVLYARRGVALTNVIEGGAQERGKRAGTENVPAIAGMAAALHEAMENLDRNAAYVTELRRTLEDKLSRIPESRINGDRALRLPGTLNMCFAGIEGESLLLLLDQAGIAASSGSACTSGSLDPSHVLLAIGVPVEVAHGSLRLSLSGENTPAQVAHIAETVPRVVAYLRSISPVWEQMQNEKA